MKNEKSWESVEKINTGIIWLSNTKVPITLCSYSYTHHTNPSRFTTK